jgi:hypothetical protein
MYLLKHKPFAVLLGGLFLFSACKKDSDSNSGPAPVVDPITVAAAKPNDTLTLKGQNFSTSANGNVVKIGDVEATVVSVSATEIKILIPTISTPGTYTITVTINGKTTEVGSIVIAPLTYYAVKGVFSTGSEYQVITINPQDGSESLVASIGQDRINDVVYFPATNEIMGVDDYGAKLLKVNVTTKKVTSVTLPSGTTSGTAQLVADNNNNLYAIKYDWSNTSHQLQSLVKIDPVTGNGTVIKTFESNDDWYEPVYVPATNDIVGFINDGTRLFRINLTTKDTAGVILPGSVKTDFRELIVDNKSNVYGYKGHYSGDASDFAKLVKFNVATGQETLVKDLPIDNKFDDKIIFVPQTNEFMGTYGQSVVFRLNAASLNYVLSPAPTVKGNTYSYLTTN